MCIPTGCPTCLPTSSGGDLATISQVLLDRFPRFLSRFIGLIETLLSNPFFRTPERPKPSARYLVIVVAVFDDIQTCPRRVPPPFRSILCSIESSRSHLSIDLTCVSLRPLVLETFSFFINIPHNSSSYLQCWVYIFRERR